jgi:segregation and condensation protein A
MTETDAYSRFFEVKLELFDGPLDLLLHLVKKKELPIEKVSLSEVTGQYLECIKSLRYYDVEVAAEYLVIAATLLSVKASVLLNEPVELVPDENGDPS